MPIDAYASPDQKTLSPKYTAAPGDTTAPDMSIRSVNGQYETGLNDAGWATYGSAPVTTANKTAGSISSPVQTTQSSSPSLSMYGNGNTGINGGNMSGAASSMYPSAVPTSGNVTYAQSGGYNPTAVNQSTQTFGQADSSQFMIQPFVQPFNYNQQKSENQSLVQGYTDAIQGQEGLDAMRQRYENRYMVPEYREMAQTGREAYQDVLNQIRGIGNQVAGTTRDSMVTAGQRAAMSSSMYQKLAPIAQDLGETVERVGAMLTEAEKNLNTAMQYDIAQQKKELMPWEWSYNMQQVMQAREMTGWSQANQFELNRLLANQQAGLTWTNAEKQRAHQLSMLEKEYDLQLRNNQKMAESELGAWFS